MCVLVDSLILDPIPLYDQGAGGLYQQLGNTCKLGPTFEQTEWYLQNGQICKFKIKERTPSPFHPLRSRFLWQSCQLNHFIFSIRIIWPRHQNSELIPLKAGFLRGDLFKPVNSFSDQTLLPPPTCDQYGLVNEYSNISWVPVIIYGVAVITVITIFSSSSPPL